MKKIIFILIIMIGVIMTSCKSDVVDEIIEDESELVGSEDVKSEDITLEA